MPRLVEPDRLLEDAGGLTCGVYIDLNVIHAGLAKTPEESRPTSVWERIQIRQAYERRERVQIWTTSG